MRAFKNSDPHKPEIEVYTLPLHDRLSVLNSAAARKLPTSCVQYLANQKVLPAPGPSLLAGTETRSPNHPFNSGGNFIYIEWIHQGPPRHRPLQAGLCGSQNYC